MLRRDGDEKRLILVLGFEPQRCDSPARTLVPAWAHMGESPVGFHVRRRASVAAEARQLVAARTVLV
jgi:hypothetical protein